MGIRRRNLDKSSSLYSTAHFRQVLLPNDDEDFFNLTEAWTAGQTWTLQASYVPNCSITIGSFDLAGNDFVGVCEVHGINHLGLEVREQLTFDHATAGAASVALATKNAWNQIIEITTLSTQNEAGTDVHQAGYFFDESSAFAGVFAPATVPLGRIGIPCKCTRNATTGRANEAIILNAATGATRTMSDYLEAEQTAEVPFTTAPSSRTVNIIMQANFYRV